MSPSGRSWTRYLFAVRDLNIDDPNAKLILYALASRADDNGYCYPSVNRIARDTALSRRTVQRRLAALEAGKFIERHLRRRVDSPRHHDTTIYRLVVSLGRYSVHDDAGGSVTRASTVGSERHPNVPSTNQYNEGATQTLEEDNPPADANDEERRRRIASMAGELVEQLRRGEGR